MKRHGPEVFDKWKARLGDRKMVSSIQEDDYALGKLDNEDVAHDDGQAAHQPQSISDNTVDWVALGRGVIVC